MLRILDITAPDINNGNGCRVTLWISGCTHHCKGCHNEWTWDFTKGKSLVENQDEILNELSNWLSKYYIEGITFSGGDPLCQDDDGLYELKMLIMWVRRNFPTKNIDMCDVIVDGPYIEEKRDIAHTPFRGSTNQRIIKIKK